MNRIIVNTKCFLIHGMRGHVRFKYTFYHKAVPQISSPLQAEDAPPNCTVKLFVDVSDPRYYSHLLWS